MTNKLEDGQVFDALMSTREAFRGTFGEALTTEMMLSVVEEELQKRQRKAIFDRLCNQRRDVDLISFQRKLKEQAAPDSTEVMKKRFKRAREKKEASLLEKEPFKPDVMTQVANGEDQSREAS